MWFNKKKPEEFIEQFVYDAYYGGICPVCKNAVIGSVHKMEIDRPCNAFDSSIIAECSKCHVAVYIRKENIVKTLKKYRHNKEALLGLELVSQEIVQ